VATGKALNGKPYAGNPHVRFDEGEVAPAATPRRGSLLYNDSGATSYRWNPPKLTPQEEKAALHARAEMLRKSAAGFGGSDVWLRAMGVTPET